MKKKKKSISDIFKEIDTIKESTLEFLTAEQAFQQAEEGIKSIVERKIKNLLQDIDYSSKRGHISISNTYHEPKWFLESSRFSQVYVLVINFLESLGYKVRRTDEEDEEDANMIKITLKINWVNK
jgi:hypothetical protein